MVAAGWPGALLALGGTASAEAQGLEPVTVQLKWHHQTQFAGLYVAEQKGFYRKEGLTVEHRPWAVGAPSPVEQVVSGAATFGITSQTQFLVDREKGAPVVAIAAIYQKSPVGFFALKSSRIKRPQHFVGKTIAFAPTHEIHLKAMFRRLGLDFASLRRVPYSFNLTPFYKGEVAVWAGYIMNQPVDVRLAGHEATIIFPDDWGGSTPTTTSSSPPRRPSAGAPTSWNAGSRLPSGGGATPSSARMRPRRSRSRSIRRAGGRRSWRCSWPASR